jgi:uncharacterized membrane protein
LVATTTSSKRSTSRSPANDAAAVAHPPRATWLAVSFVLALAGAGVAAYLTSVHYDRRLLVCGVGDCETVQQSRFAEVGGIPVAVLGLGMYLAIAALALLRWRRPETAATATMAAFALALAGAIFAAYLTYVEIWVIDAICQWCVASALLTLGILVVEGFGTWRALGDGGEFELSG